MEWFLKGNLIGRGITQEFLMRLKRVDCFLIREDLFLAVEDNGYMNTLNTCGFHMVKKRRFFQIMPLVVFNPVCVKK